MLVPLYGFVPGDTLGVLVLVQSEDTIEALAETLAQAVSVRVASSNAIGIRKNDVRLDPRISVAEAGLTPLDRVDLTVENREP